MGQPEFESANIGDYLTIEREDGVRYEYHDGEIFAMTGGTITNSRICGNAFSILRNSLSGKDCEAFLSEIKIEIVRQRRYVYPDASVFCGKLIESENTKGAATNPTLLIEVTSESSVEYDRGRKFSFYRQLKSLREYLIVSQSEPAVTLYRRKEDTDLFKIIDVLGLDATIKLKSVGLTIILADLYQNIEFTVKKSQK